MANPLEPKVQVWLRGPGSDRTQFLLLALQLFLVLLEGVGFALFFGHRELFLEFAGVRFGGPLDIPDEADLLQNPEQVGGRIELAFEHPVVRRDRPGVVIVVVGLAPRKVSENPAEFVAPEALEPEIRTHILGIEVALAELVAAGIHPISNVVGEEDAEHAAVEEAAIGPEAGRPADERRHHEPKAQPHEERIAVEHDLPILLELRIGVPIEEEPSEPADVGVPKTMNRAVQIIIRVGMNVMVVVVGEPIDHFALRGCRAEHEKEPA